MIVESRERRGCRVVPLSLAVRGAGVDLYRLTPEARSALDVDATLAEAFAHVGQPYGWHQIIRIALTHLPLGLLLQIRWLRRSVPHRRIPDSQYEACGGRMICSELVSHAVRVGGVDLVPNLADKSTTPGDLGRSAWLRCEGVLSA